MEQGRKDGDLEPGMVKAGVNPVRVAEGPAKIPAVDPAKGRAEDRAETPDKAATKGGIEETIS